MALIYFFLSVHDLPLSSNLFCLLMRNAPRVLCNVKVCNISLLFILVFDIKKFFQNMLET